ncbi:MAG TPA: ATP-binding protein, partial [Clostridia bacterium]|nr:ATP-binding protein [Clostridia bacterium]
MAETGQKTREQLQEELEHLKVDLAAAQRQLALEAEGRMQAEEALRTAKQRNRPSGQANPSIESSANMNSALPDYKRLFEAAPGLYLVLAPDLRIVAVSDAYLQATLTRRADIVGRHLFEVFPDNPNDPNADSIRNTRASMNRVLQSHVPDVMMVQRHDVRRPEPEGGGFEERYWSPVNSPVLNPDGSLAYIMHRVENVTDFVRLKQQGVEQSKLTEQLRNRAVQMEADLYSRSREVAESNLKIKQANEELARLYEKTRELDKIKSQFFANVSHELRTPLTLILGPIKKLLAAPSLNEEQRRDLEVVQRNARTLLKHVNDLLDLSKLQVGKMEASYAQVDLAWLVRVVASLFESVVAERQVSFAVETPPGLPAQVDPDKVQRVLLNLLSNAFKFTPAGGKIQVHLQEQAGKGVLSVADTGPGIPAAQREAVFERFRQLDAGATRHFGGTGLGLSIVKEFVLLHGGRVQAGEAPGEGALFTVELPLLAPVGAQVRNEAQELDSELCRQAMDELRPTKHPPQAVTGGSSANAPLVLVVEDNPDMSSYISETLGREYRVVSAANGKQ